MRLIPIVMVAALAAATPNAVRAQAPAQAGVNAARELLHASGAVDAMVAAMRANIPAQREALPQIPAEFWSAFETELVKKAPEMVDSIAVVYAHRFSARELQDITAFYQSPIGRKLVQNQIAIISESSAIGQRWGARVGEEIARSLIK
jgi:hypothetical protein